MYRSSWFWTLVLSLAVIVSCGKVNNDGTDPNTPDPTPTTPVDNPPEGVVDDSAGFYMRYVRNANYTYVDHKGSLTPAESCVAAQGEQIFCYVEAQEGDLYFNGIQLQYNVPSTLCDYVRWTPYFYYFLEPGVGAVLVHSDTDKNGVTGFDSDDSGIIGDNGADVLGVPGCDYDYSRNVPAGPNCCEGNYLLKTRVWDSTNNVYSETDTTVSWGGKKANCIAGPAADSQNKTLDGYPESDIFYVSGTGLNKIYDVRAPIKKFGTDSVEYAANYFTNADTFLTTGTAPVGLNPPQAIYVNPFYDIQCLDRAFEKQAEILMLVRKWNTGPLFANLAADPTQFNFQGFNSAPWNFDQLDSLAGWLEFGNTSPWNGSPWPGLNR